ncbi:T9SS type A sorting domain-containing protein [Wenyingzhuangia sp. IMCC45533]
MIKKLLFVGAILLSTLANAQIVINEIQYDGTDTVELKNSGSSSVDVSSYWLCNFPMYTQVSNLTIVSGNNTIPAGGLLVLTGFSLGSDGELGLYASSAFSSSDAIVDYVEWGSTGHTRSSVGVSAGTWTSNNFVPAVGTNQSIQFDGTGDTASDYTAATPTFGAENSNTTLSSTLVSNNLKVKVSTNPLSNIININVENPSYKATIYNLLGMTVASYKDLSDHSTLNVSSLAGGVYILEVITSNNDYAKIKVMIE